jgi:hypothetical protein
MLLLATDSCEMSQPGSAVLVPRGAVANTVFPKLVSRKETFPVSGADPPNPVTVAVSE